MKVSLDLEYTTPREWAQIPLGNFDAFLQDHADCERKASAMAMSFVAKCPDKTEIIPLLIETALEELEHFQQVYQVMEKRGIRLRQDIEEDHYVNELIRLCRHSKEERMLDRMLLASIIECRGAERFRLIEEGLEDAELKKFYKTLWATEAKHGNIFVEMALKYWNQESVLARLSELNKREAEICRKLPWRAAMH